MVEEIKSASPLLPERADTAASGGRPSARSVGIRLFWGISLGAIVVALLAYGGWLLLVAAIVASWMALREFFVLTKCDKPRTIFPLRRLGYIFVGALLVLTFLEPYLGASYLELLLVLFLISTFVYQMGRFSMEKANFLYELAITLLGSLYIGGLLSFALKLWNLQASAFIAVNYPQLGNGFAFLPLVPLVGAWGYDTSAFFSGAFFGFFALRPDRLCQLSTRRISSVRCSGARWA